MTITVECQQKEGMPALARTSAITGTPVTSPSYPSNSTDASTGRIASNIRNTRNNAIDMKDAANMDARNNTSKQEGCCQHKGTQTRSEKLSKIGKPAAA
jgi:hypothetical protein